VPSQAVLDRRVEILPPQVRESELVDRSRTFASVVYVLEAGKAKTRPVRAGVSDLTDTVILEGLEEGARVIVGPFRVLRDLEDGKQVSPESEDAIRANLGDQADGEGADAGSTR